MGCHAAAFIGAPTACLGTFLAMAHRIFSALVAARFTYICARLANGAGKFAAARHISGRHPAYGRAIHVQRNAARHGFGVIFLQARSRAKIASLGAGIACVYA